MKRRFLVNPLVLTACLGTALTCLIFTGVMLHISRPGSALLFGAVALLFLGVATQYGAVITLSARGVSRSVLGVTRKTLRWEEIGEVGVAGLRVVNDPKSKHVGTIYIYFSEKPLTEKERFDMLLRWPHWNQCYLRFSHERVKAVQMLWDRKIETFNIGDLSLSEGLKN